MDCTPMPLSMLACSYFTQLCQLVSEDKKHLQKNRFALRTYCMPSENVGKNRLNYVVLCYKILLRKWWLSNMRCNYNVATLLGKCISKKRKKSVKTFRDNKTQKRGEKTSKNLNQNYQFSYAVCFNGGWKQVFEWEIHTLLTSLISHKIYFISIKVHSIELYLLKLFL